MNSAVRELRPYMSAGDSPGESEAVIIAAICNRVARKLGLLDREGLQYDLAIVQSKCALHLEALLASPDGVFIDELLHILESTDRATGSLAGSFYSRFMRG